MLHYNPDSDTFYPRFSIGLFLSQSKNVLVSDTLEFILVDANKKLVEVENLSQLFISLKILKQ